MRTLSSHQVFAGKVINVVKDRVLLDNGKETCREVVRHRHAAAVVALDEKSNVLLVEQYRYSIQKDMTELPAGLIDEGETSLEAAKRELLEETGHVAKNWRLLTEIYPSSGVHDEKIYIYLATKIEKISGLSLDGDEVLVCKKEPFNTFLEKVKAGAIMDGKTALGILLAESVL